MPNRKGGGRKARRPDPPLRVEVVYCGGGQNLRAAYRLLARRFLAERSGAECERRSTSG